MKKCLILGAHELYPMLSSSEDDALERETGYLTPITPVNSISNPTYHHMPTIRNENSKKVNSDIIRTPDNYISMHQYKNIVNSNFRDSGIGSPVQLDLEKDKKARYYANTNASMWNNVDL